MEMGKSARSIDPWPLSRIEGAKRPKSLAVLDPLVQDVFHFRSSRVYQNAPVTERARAPLLPSLVPANDFAFGEELGGEA